MSAHTNHGKIILEKRNSGQKSTLTERDRRTLRRIVSKKSRNYCSTGNRAADLNIHLEDPVSTKTLRMRYTNPESMVGLELLNL
jgi:hypothetical protein